ncbi:MAG: FeoB-associated Cys-rich membrane protein [Algibacter sp.]
MNTIIQNILVFTALALAVGYIVKKYMWAPKKKTKACGGNNGCGCH